MYKSSVACTKISVDVNKKKNEMEQLYCLPVHGGGWQEEGVWGGHRGQKERSMNFPWPCSSDESLSFH